MLSCTVISSLLCCFVTLTIYFRYIFKHNTSKTVCLVLLIDALLIGCVPLFFSKWINSVNGICMTLYLQLFDFICLFGIVFGVGLVIVIAFYFISLVRYRLKLSPYPFFFIAFPLYYPIKSFKSNLVFFLLLAGVSDLIFGTKFFFWALIIAVVDTIIALWLKKRITQDSGPFQFKMFLINFFVLFCGGIFLLQPTSLMIGMFGIGFGLFMTVWACRQGTKVPSLKTTIVQSYKILSPLKIVFLSDLHIYKNINPDKIDGIVHRVNSVKPDIVILGGDVISDPLDYVAELLSKLKNIKASHKFVVSGNHDWSYGYTQCVEMLESLGYTFLDNMEKSVNGIYIAGIFNAPDHNFGGRLSDVFKHSADFDYRILVAHAPVNLKKDNVFDLELAGHTHGGQVFPFHIFAKLYNQYLSGLYHMENDALLYVSRGAGQSGPQMRLFAPSEITVIQLEPQQKGE